MIFYGIVGSGLVSHVPGDQQLRNLFPFASQFFMCVEDDRFLLGRPLISIDLGIKMIVPSMLVWNVYLSRICLEERAS